MFHTRCPSFSGDIRPLSAPLPTLAWLRTDSLNHVLLDKEETEEEDEEKQDFQPAVLKSNSGRNIGGVIGLGIYLDDDYNGPSSLLFPPELSDSLTEIKHHQPRAIRSTLSCHKFPPFESPQATKHDLDVPHSLPIAAEPQTKGRCVQQGSQFRSQSYWKASKSAPMVSRSRSSCLA